MEGGRGEGGIVYNAHAFEVRVNRTMINQQKIKFNQPTDVGHMTRTARYGRFSAVFGMSDTASARTLYGRIRR